MLALVLSLPPEVVEGENEARQRVGTEGWVDALLKVLSVRHARLFCRLGQVTKLTRVPLPRQVYRKKDPASSDEVEFMENCFDALCSALSSPTPAPSAPDAPAVHPVKTAFLDGEGVELLVLMLKAKNLSRTRAIKALDHALQGREGAPLCERFVEALGLKTLFAVFMGRVRGLSLSLSLLSFTRLELTSPICHPQSEGGKKKKSVATTHEDTEHMLSLLSSLFTSLPSDTPLRMRLLAKFVESDYEKVDRLCELREELERRIERGVDPAIATEMDEDELYLEKLDNGLFALQLADYVAAWVCMEDDGVRRLSPPPEPRSHPRSSRTHADPTQARDHLKMLLSRRDKSLRDIVAVLDEYRDNIGVDDDLPEDAPPSEGEERRAILDQLARYLESVA